VTVEQENEMPVIRVSDATWARLKKWAEPLEDSPDDAIGRVLDLAERHESPPFVGSQGADKKRVREGAVAKSRTRLGTEANMLETATRSVKLSGKKLKRLWDVPAVQVLAHRDGTFFEVPSEFPCALCDADGYVLFKTEDALRNSMHLRIGQKLNVPAGIHRIPGYVQKR
jgi:hypothetical protein